MMVCGSLGSLGFSSYCSCTSYELGEFDLKLRCPETDLFIVLSLFVAAVQLGLIRIYIYIYFAV